MSKYPYSRIKHWKKKEGHTHGEVLAESLTYDQATVREREEAEKRNCTQSPGGQRDDSREWAVYHVWGERTS